MFVTYSHDIYSKKLAFVQKLSVYTPEQGSATFNPKRAIRFGVLLTKMQLGAVDKSTLRNEHIIFSRPIRLVCNTQLLSVYKNVIITGLCYSIRNIFNFYFLLLTASHTRSFSFFPKPKCLNGGNKEPYVAQERQVADLCLRLF